MHGPLFDFGDWLIFHQYYESKQKAEGLRWKQFTLKSKNLNKTRFYQAEPVHQNPSGKSRHYDIPYYTL
jgi:hypothetical protein